MQLPPNQRSNSLISRMLGWTVLALFLVALGAGLLVGLTALLVFLLLLIPVALLLAALSLTQRGRFRVHVHRTRPARGAHAGEEAPRLKQLR